MTLVVYAVLAGIRLHNAMDMEQTAPNNASNNTHLKETGPAKSGEAATNSRSISFLQNTSSFHRRPANKNFLDVKERCRKWATHLLKNHQNNVPKKTSLHKDLL